MFLLRTRSPTNILDKIYFMADTRNEDVRKALTQNESIGS